MRDRLTDANFPRTDDQRVYHLGLRSGEVANRIVTVGSHSRAEKMATYLDVTPPPFILSSERGFLTYTGRYKGTPVSIISIGMGSPNMDFFVREVRECVLGDMYIVRLGSCGALADVPVGTVVVPKASVAVSRNVDFDFVNPEGSPPTEPAYRISKQVPADPILHAAVYAALKATIPAGTTKIIKDVVNASADSFYSSQGRTTSFPDHNADLIHKLQSSVTDLATLEMETFHLYHLAACWDGQQERHINLSDRGPPSSSSSPSSSSPSSSSPPPKTNEPTKIRAAAAQMVFASRASRDFITPEHVVELEAWTSQAVLRALFNTEISMDRLHPEQASVWEF